ncbi:PREDICTED: (-)-alpha-pinene synthase-like [Fragaria vesca subsp. vesca]|uniref:(-)-alpha-pinene synthase-like n=1 Tax=Fragaria vesca subsp. vesca TaxID=101020 RepID=UPI0002C370FE|nr:PREDICTED: (-)-alpha-pinene synthase-like [Fragaria vesca subsp. vesca]
MSTQLASRFVIKRTSASLSIQTPKIVNPEILRRTAIYHPSIWGDRFSNYEESQDPMTRSLLQKQVNQLKVVVKREVFRNASSDFSTQMKSIDAMQRLGIAYHFERDIENALEQAHAACVHDGNLYNVALRFRLLREHGYNVSSDIFKRFKDANDNFKEGLTSDLPGMLSFYEATHLRIHGEDILEDGLHFTTAHLESSANDVNHPLAAQITQALERPLRKFPERLYARHYISIFPDDPKSLHHEAVALLLKLAKLDFNLVQSLHKKELSEIIRWWDELDFERELPFARNRIVELYFWTLGVYAEPQYSKARHFLTKAIAFGSVLDDIYDAYGSFEELKIFTEAIQRWDVNCIDELPDYMKIFYRRLFILCNEIEVEMVKQGKSYRVHFAKEIIKAQARLYFAEAQWLHENYTPSMDEYMEVSVRSVGNSFLSTMSLVGMGDIVTKDAFEWLANHPKILRASNIIFRLMDDLVSGKFEKEREHIASSIDCYMKQYGVSEQETVDIFNKKVVDSWKDINEEFLRPTAVPVPVLTRVLNLTRVVDLLYKKDDEYTRVGDVMKDGVASLLIHPVPS